MNAALNHENIVEPIWFRNGDFLGYRESEILWGCDGVQFGRFINDTVYDRRGKYLGEFNEDRRFVVYNNFHGLVAGFVPHRGPGRPRMPRKTRLPRRIFF